MTHITDAEQTFVIPHYSYESTKGIRKAFREKYGFDFGEVDDTIRLLVEGTDDCVVALLRLKAWN